MALENTKFREAIDKTFDRKMQIRGRICCTYFLFLIISLAKKKKQTNNNKQTNKHTERTLAGTPRQLWPITAGADTNTNNNNNNNKRQEVLKDTAIQEKLQLHTTSYWTRQGTSTITF